MPDTILIAGEKGSGKTTLAANFALKYKTMYPNHHLYLISPVYNNKRLMSLNPTKINMSDMDKSHENFVDPDLKINPDDLKNSLVIFDDLEYYDEDKERKGIMSGVYSLLNNILICGRKNNISVVYIRHCMNDYKKTITIQRESTAIFFSTKGGLISDIKRTLDKQGYSRKQIKEILSLRSSFIGVIKSCPRYILGSDIAKSLDWRDE